MSNAHQTPVEETSELLNLLIRALVDFPNEVNVQTLEGSQSTIFEVSVHPEDVRRIIGRRGRTAQSIRTVVRAAAARDAVEVDVDFVD